jgi:hypothetical protein
MPPGACLSHMALTGRSPVPPDAVRCGRLTGWPPAGCRRVRLGDALRAPFRPVTDREAMSNWACALRRTAPARSNGTGAGCTNEDRLAGEPMRDLLEDLRRGFGIAFIVCLPRSCVVRQFCERVALMCLGKVVGIGGRHTIGDIPGHLYTQASLPAVSTWPWLMARRRTAYQTDQPPASPRDPHSGYWFRTRCWKATD